MGDKGWDSSGGISGGAGSGGQKGFQRQAPPPRPPAVVPNSSGNYSRPSPPPSGGMGPINNVGQQPIIPDINAYLGHDTTYQGQVRGFQKALADYLASETQQRSQVNQDYGSATHALQSQKTLDLNNIMQDYASRGLLQSGLYAGALSDYNQNYLQQLGQLTTQQRRALAALLSGETNFRKEQTLSEQKAREDAIARRAAQYGIG